jgi:prepilin-type N-terminal cleavage/methylation domain-containing protein
MGPARSLWPGRGYSLIELMFVLGLVAITSGIIAPRLLAGLDDARTRGAARYLASRLQQTRMEAVARNATVALRFMTVDGGLAVVPFLDGNRNGVRSLDIQRGVDRPLRREERLKDQFPEVDFGTLPDLPAVDGSSAPPDSDPVRLGSSDAVSFTPDGTATPGSLYLLGRGGTQLVVRIFGETGKTRILRYEPRNRTWNPL